eukprot:Skav233417  [mRNA]  locus=scaffold892:190800:191396:- [translate_table: standard]
MLAANAHLHVWPSAATSLNCHGDQLANTVRIQAHKRILLDNAFGLVLWQERACIISAQAIGGLGQVIGSKAEEFGHFCQFACLQGCTWKLDHGANLVDKINSLLLCHLSSCLLDHTLQQLQLFNCCHQGDHDLSHWLFLGASAYFSRSPENGSCLHLADLRIGDGQSAATMTKHRVGLLQLCSTSAHSIQRYTCCFGD